MHGASRAIAPALGRLAGVASRRGSPLGHLRSTSRARSLRCLQFGRRVSQSRRSWLLLSQPPMVVLPSRVSSERTSLRGPSLRPSAVSLASRLVAAFQSDIFGRRRASARSAAFGSALCHKVAAFVDVSLTPVNGCAVLLRVFSQCTSLLAPSLRHSAVSLASRLVSVPHSAIFGQRRALTRSAFVTSASCLTIAAFFVASLAFANGGAAFARKRSTDGASRLNAPALGRLARVASRRGSQLGHLQSMSRARSLRCLRIDVASHSRMVRDRFSRIRQWRC